MQKYSSTTFQQNPNRRPPLLNLEQQKQKIEQQEKQEKKKTHLEKHVISSGFSYTVKRTPLRGTPYMIFGLVLAFFMLLVLNVYLDYRLGKAFTVMEKEYFRALPLNNIEEEYINVAKRADIYFDVTSGRPLLKDKTNIVYDNLLPGILIKNVKITRDGFTLAAQGENVVAFSKVLARFISEESISKIILKSANLSPHDGVYEVLLEGVFL